MEENTLSFLSPSTYAQHSTSTFNLKEMSAYEFVTHVFGTIYLVSWSLSFYPQAWENLVRKSVKGFSFEFAILHPIAYFFYTIYTYTGRIDQHSATGVVVIADVIFSTHGFMLTSVHLSQFLIYKRGGERRFPRRWCIIFVGVEVSLIAFFFLLEINGIKMPLLMQTQMLCGYGLVVTNICKYTAQFYFNMRRKSTVGFSIKLVFLDFFGALFSLLQLLMDSIGQGESVVGQSAFNIVKFLISIIGVLFDIGFMIQHYCLYSYAVYNDQKKQVYEVRKGKRDELTEMVQAKLENIQGLENLQSNSDKSRTSQVSIGDKKGEEGNILEVYYNRHRGY
eukprot:403336799